MANAKPFNPYVGPRSFEATDASWFFGRDREARTLLSLVISEPLVLFYAQSGAGKSSLLKARLIPSLLQEGFRAFPIGRVGGSLPDDVADVDSIYVYSLLLSLNPDQNGMDPTQLKDMSLVEYLKAEQAKNPDATVSRVLIIDQFEEIVTTHVTHWEERADFFRQLNEALTTDDQLWVVLTMREDHAAALDPFTELLDDRLRARFYMQRMMVDAALDAVQQPAAAAGRPFAANVAEELVDNLRQIRSSMAQTEQLGQFVEPVQLQVVCYELWESLHERQEEAITQQDVDELGDPDEALARYYENALAKVLQGTETHELELRNWFETHLITEAATRGTVYGGQTYTAGLNNRIIKGLTDQYLLRAERRAGGTWYELVHDRFILPILQSNQAWRGRQDPVLRAAIAWAQEGRSREKLLQDEALADALATINPETAVPVVQDYLRASEAAQSESEIEAAQQQAAIEAANAAEKEKKATRFRRLSIFMILLFIVGIAATVWAIIAFAQQNQSASRAAAVEVYAVEQESTAVAASDTESAARIGQETASAADLALQQTAEAASAEVVAQRATAEAAGTVAVQQLATAEAASAAAVSQRVTAQAARDEAQQQQIAAVAAREDTESQGQIRLLQALTLNALDAVQVNDTELSMLLTQQVITQSVQLEKVSILTITDTTKFQATVHDIVTPLLSHRYFNTLLTAEQAHEGSVSALAFNGDRLISAGAGGNVYRWILTQPGLQPETLVENDPNIEFVLLSRNGETLVHASGQTIHVRKSTDGRYQLIELNMDTFSCTNMGPFVSMGLAESGSKLAAATQDQGQDFKMRAWDLAQVMPDCKTLASNLSYEFLHPAFSVDESRVYAFAPNDRDPNFAGIFEWNWSSSSLTTKTSARLPLVYSPDNTLVAYRRVDDAFSYAPLPDRFPIAEASPTDRGAYFRIIDGIRSILDGPAAFSTDNTLFAAAQENNIRLWQLDPSARTVVELAPLRGHEAPVTALQFGLVDGVAVLASGDQSGEIRLWWPNETAVAYNVPAQNFVITPNGEALIYTNGSSVAYANIANGMLVTNTTTLLDNDSRIESIAIGPDGGFAIGRNRTTEPVITYWPSLTDEPMNFTGYRSQVYDLAFSPDDAANLLTTGGEDRRLQIWELDESITQDTLGTSGQRIAAVAWHPDGQRITLARRFNGVVEVWDRASGANLATFTIADEVNVLAFSPDGRYLVAGAVSERTQSGAIYVWEADNLSAPPVILAGHTGGVNDVAFFGQQMASASDDGSVRLWQLDTLSSVSIEMLGHTQPVTAVAYTPDGRLVSADGETVRFWFIIEEYVANGCQQVRRNLTQEEWRNYLGDDTPYQATCELSASP